MKSIKEKAEEYGFQNPIIYYDADGNTYDDVDNPSMDFEAGANYVLDIIEQYRKEHIVCNSNLNHIIEQLKK